MCHAHVRGPRIRAPSPYGEQCGFLASSPAVRESKWQYLHGGATYLRLRAWFAWRRWYGNEYVFYIAGKSKEQTNRCFLRKSLDSTATQK